MTSCKRRHIHSLLFLKMNFDVYHFDVGHLEFLIYTTKDSNPGNTFATLIAQAQVLLPCPGAETLQIVILTVWLICTSNLKSIAANLSMLHPWHYPQRSFPPADPIPVTLLTFSDKIPKPFSVVILQVHPLSQTFPFIPLENYESYSSPPVIETANKNLCHLV